MHSCNLCLLLFELTGVAFGGNSLVVVADLLEAVGTAHYHDKRGVGIEVPLLDGFLVEDLVT